MTKVIVTGHGGYGTAIQRNLGMLLGETPGFRYVDFNLEDTIDSLKANLKDAMEQFGNDEILIACDLVGGSPFKQAAMIAMENPHCIVVGGLNTAAYAEIAYMLDYSVSELADLAIRSVNNSVGRFPEKLK